jgi:recombination protein RecT
MSEQAQQTPPAQALTIKNLFGKDEVRKKFEDMLGKRAAGFITSVLQIVSSNKLLVNAEPHSVYHSAAVAATLDLPLNNNLGFAYIVPYNESYKDKLGVWQKRQVAQFQMGYKGFIQLGQRTGQYKTINAIDVREGELIGRNLLTGECVFKWEQDEEKRDALPIIGYVSYFELINGFSKAWYMSKAKIFNHAKRYSETFKSDKGNWVKNFDAMALKTVLKLNISKYGPLSVDMQIAIKADQSVIKNFDTDTNTMDVSYVDGAHEQIEEEKITLDELLELYNKNSSILSDKLDKDAQRVIEGKEVESYEKIAIAINSEVGEANKQS